MKQLIELQTRIYNQNKEVGWHDKPRTFNTFVCLFHSELSEGMEGVRKDQLDNHLPAYPMIAVELADFVIRILDWFGLQQDESICAELREITKVSWRKNWDEMDWLAEIHGDVSAAKYFYDVSGEYEMPVNHLSKAISEAFAMANFYGWDLMQIIEEKLEYNKHRADHKRENRSKPDGKKF